MEVGINCCDRLTGSTIATDTRRLIEKRKRFVSSVRWRTDSTGTETIVLFGKVIGIVTEDAVCRINANGRVGKIEFQSKIGAKLKIFDLMKSGELRDFLRKPSR